MAKKEYKWVLTPPFQCFGVLYRKWLGIWWTVNSFITEEDAHNYVRDRQRKPRTVYLESD